MRVRAGFAPEGPTASQKRSSVDADRLPRQRPHVDLPEQSEVATKRSDATRASGSMHYRRFLSPRTTGSGKHSQVRRYFVPNRCV